ncbi:hypothetical protein [Klebsiella pneumoniae]|uniref:hypothetical protein n=1 Tax=Klebsiella pneumoniae TaxID=573 RepID=UPI000C79ED8C|nr:hypothetical protein [Klebsiella pneumoniae]HDS7949762.1 hypothetical protein [Klebsiella pneumoniae subsp. pneumoniae]EKY0528872.1 hypothetical protein [Klebsiella pneumoniae]MCP6512783.1 hypothetical protein [Klebsiella pneumoniae]MDW1509474.1 hypothetical protein [Klebsiella pneumoniae]MDW1524778.1 hypothetical protein [Klebsiella pneumoniae]
MGSKDSNYQVVYRYEPLMKYIPGGWVLFQRPKSCGGGFWLGKTYDGVFMFELDRPVSLSEGVKYIILSSRVSENFMDFDDEFRLT